MKQAKIVFDLFNSGFPTTMLTLAILLMAVSCGASFAIGYRRGSEALARTLYKGLAEQQMELRCPRCGNTGTITVRQKMEQ